MSGTIPLTLPTKADVAPAGEYLGSRLSFACTKENRRKENTPRENGNSFRVSRPLCREAISIYGDSYVTDENPEIASTGNGLVVVRRGRDSIFAKGCKVWSVIDRRNS